MIDNLEIVKEKVDFPIDSELKKLGVSKIISFVAKGWRGFVFKVKIGNKIAALKIGSPERLLKEANVLKTANRIRIGPKLYNSTHHCVAMQFIYGKRYPDFIETASKTQTKQTVLKILKQAEKLDKAGIDHGELSRADKHIIVRVSGAPGHRGTERRSGSTVSRCPRIYFIDFEKGSTVRKPHNFGSVLNYLLLNPHSFVARKTREKLNIQLKEVKRYARQSSWRKEGSWTRSWAGIF
jgi:putative serine/threonine protein kinase|tara:strand:+ start:588 stop:1301 length:714 start_codon:yes stop_codon:yes gene_type:complete